MFKKSIFNWAKIYPRPPFVYLKGFILAALVDKIEFKSPGIVLYCCQGARRAGRKINTLEQLLAFAVYSGSRTGICAPTLPTSPLAPCILPPNGRLFGRLFSDDDGDDDGYDGCMSIYVYSSIYTGRVSHEI
jgi:hypothetical protein